MSTDIRPEISDKNKYWISRHRYYELKHFCLQYPTWKQAYNSLDGLSKRPDDLLIFVKSGQMHGDPTERCVESREVFAKRMEMVEQTAHAADPELAAYILRGVTEGMSYETLKIRLDIPCCRDVYYDRYRRFFWLLNSVRE